MISHAENMKPEVQEMSYEACAQSTKSYNNYMYSDMGMYEIHGPVFSDVVVVYTFQGAHSVFPLPAARVFTFTVCFHFLLIDSCD